MLPVTVTLTFDLLTTKSIGDIYGAWISMILRKAYIDEISLKLISGQEVPNDKQKR